MAFTYVPATIATRAHDAVRFLVRDTKNDRPFLTDDEIDAALAFGGMLPGDNPIANLNNLYGCAAIAARSIQAKFASESEIAITALGASKSTAAAAYEKLARYLEAQQESDAAPTFVSPVGVAGPDAVHPSGYPNEWIAGVDPVPDLDIP